MSSESSPVQIKYATIRVFVLEDLCRLLSYLPIVRVRAEQANYPPLRRRNVGSLAYPLHNRELRISPMSCFEHV